VCAAERAGRARTVDGSPEGFDASVARTLGTLAAQREALLDSISSSN
jgi:hypothetical protein